MFTAWITNLTNAIRVAATLKLMANGFAPSDIAAMTPVVVVAIEYQLAA